MWRDRCVWKKPNICWFLYKGSEVTEKYPKSYTTKTGEKSYEVEITQKQRRIYFMHISHHRDQLLRRLHSRSGLQLGSETGKDLLDLPAP